MRLVCPNCDAEYEVDASVIPEGGRDVQCSSCGHAWFQLPLEVEAEIDAGIGAGIEAAATRFDPPSAMGSAPEPAAEAAAPAAAAIPPSPPIRPRALEESVLAVLREEAERETAARRAEAPVGILETQEELALVEAPPQPPSAPAARPISEVPTPEPGKVHRRDLLPDIEEINQTLRPSDEARDDGIADGGAAADPRGGQGFRTGFALALVLAALLVTVYVLAPALARQIPAAAPALASYAAGVDAARLWLDGLLKSAIGAIEGNGS